MGIASALIRRLWAARATRSAFRCVDAGRIDEGKASDQGDQNAAPNQADVAPPLSKPAGGHQLRGLHRDCHADDCRRRTGEKGYHALNGEERRGAGKGHSGCVGGKVDPVTFTRRHHLDFAPLRGRGRVGNCSLHRYVCRRRFTDGGRRYYPRTFFFCPGCDTSTTISVQTGRVCTIRYRSGGGIFSQKVMVRPRGGVYGTADVSYGAYKPNLGFIGSDSFQVDIEYERWGQRTVTHLKATVNVRP